jgi:hypothetical protein
MRIGRLLWLLACVALAGCASEGGVTGTGVSAISGNVVLVSAQSAPAAAPILPFPIRVTIAEFPGIADTTDADGTFQLEGAFAGAVTLQFANAADGAEIGPLPLEVPAGSQTVLENIEIHTTAPPPDRVRPAAVRLFDVFGRVDLVECNADGTGTLLVTDDGRPPRQFMMSLTADTDITTSGGEPLTCADIHRRGSVRVEGLLRRAEQTIDALVVVVGPARPPHPGPGPRPERARGVIVDVSCERGLVVFEQRGVGEPVRRVLRLTEHTEFRCAADVTATCDCGAVVAGDPIAVTGTISPAQPGQIQAEVVFLGAATLPVDVTGTVTHVACALGGLALADVSGGQSTRVALTPDTRIVCPSDLLCQCADLHPRQRVRVEGEQPAAGGAITADRITVLARRSTR